MRKRSFIWMATTVAFFAGQAGGCKDDSKDDEPESGADCDPKAPDCAEGEVCEKMADGTGQCFAPVLLRGKVVDALSMSPISGAVVQAMDANEAPAGTWAETDGNGVFELKIAAPRDAAGKPQEAKYTLRAQAKGYEVFPTPIRPALPIDAATATAGEDAAYVVESAATEIRLLPLAGGGAGLGVISGAVKGDKPGGVLVVAEGSSEPLHSMSDSTGAYIIFNVPAGSYTVRGYAQNVQLSPASVSLAAGEEKTGVDLEPASKPLAQVTGKVAIVNAPGGSVTSVVLALECTFVENVARGVVPPGLRATNISGDFTIEGVPEGQYVVLAAFENDNLVRDPDQTIGGTAIVHIKVAGSDIALAEGFKVTGALQVFSPGALTPERVTSAKPVFEWADDSSEDGYEIKVFDAYGKQLWKSEIPGTSGGGNVKATYAGPGLQAGMYYQFRVWSWREKKGKRTYISATEDLRGVFFL